MPRVATRRPHHDDQSAIKKTRRDKPRLSAFAAVRRAADVDALAEEEAEGEAPPDADGDGVAMALAAADWITGRK